MMTHSLSKEMLGTLLPDESVTVFLVGYQDPGHPWPLVEGRQEFHHHQRPSDSGASHGSVFRLFFRSWRQPGHRRLASQDLP